LADPPGFLARWSRRKQADRDAAARRGKANSAASPQSLAAAPEEPPAIEDLPALETLTKDSDFRPFMRAGVPEELRNQALRKLWMSDPLYANLDGLLEYGEDFAEPFRMAGVVATVYRVLEGMPDPEPPAADTPPPAEPAAPDARVGRKVSPGSASNSNPDEEPSSSETAAVPSPQRL
jgi:uncharacterized protein DUF3306